MLWIFFKLQEIEFMQVTVDKKRKKPSKTAKAELIKKMLEEKRLISKHIRKGGSLEELEKKGYHFATV